MKCKICNKKYGELRTLAYHISVSHSSDITKQDYTIKYLYNGKVPFCKCGCGEMTEYRYFGKFMSYVNGHNARVKNPFMGGLDKTKKELSEIYYKRYKDGKWNNPRKQSLIDIKCTGCGVKFKVSATYKNQKYCSKSCYLTNTKCTGTEPENKVEQIFNKNNINFIRNKKIKKYFVDFYLPKFNMGLEVDGDFWHCNPLIFQNDYFHPIKMKMAKEIWKSDKKRHSNIVKSGITLNRIWESEISENKILKMLNIN